MNKNLSRFATTDVIFGYHSICEALRAKKRKILKFYTLKQNTKAWLKIQKEFETSRFEIQHVPKEVLSRIAGSDDHMGLVAAVMPFKYKKTIFEPKSHPFILLLAF